MEHTITSIKDPRVVAARLLQSARERHKAKKCLVEGEISVGWAVDYQVAFDCVFVQEGYEEIAVVVRLRNLSVPILAVSEGVMRKIHERSYTIPVVAVVNIPEGKHKADFVVVLDGVRDLGNLGTIVRTSAAFDIHDFIMTNNVNDVWYQKTIDASRGSVFSANITHYDSPQETVRILKELGYRIVVTTPHEGSVLQPFVRLHAQPTAVVVGNETEGVSAELLAAADEKVKIPMGMSVESLNVGVATGISLYELRMKWILAMLQNKIQNLLARDFYAAAQWMRKIFDAKLRQSTPLTADQVIVLMVLACDRTASMEKLLRDAGIGIGVDGLLVIQPLHDLGYVMVQNDIISMTPAGEAAIAQIWFLQQEVEAVALADVTSDDIATTKKVLAKIFQNCERVIPFDH